MQTVWIRVAIACAITQSLPGLQIEEVEQIAAVATVGFMSDNFFERLKRLSEMLPALKKQYADSMMAGRAKRNGKLPSAAIPCALCGKHYGAPFPKKVETKIIQPKHKPYCPTCQKNLDSGWCAITTLDGKRFSWFAGNDLPEHFSGQVVPVGEAEYEKILEHYKASDAKS